MAQQFNDHYKNNFDHGWKVTVDERIFWGWARDQPVGCHKVDKNQEVLVQSINACLQLGSK